MRKQTIYLAFFLNLLLFTSLIFSIPAKASTNYINTSLNHLPLVETDDYIVFLFELDGLRIKVFDKASKTFTIDQTLLPGVDIRHLDAEAINSTHIAIGTFWFKWEGANDDNIRFTFFLYDLEKASYIKKDRIYWDGYDSSITENHASNLLKASSNKFYMYVYCKSEMGEKNYILKITISGSTISISTYSIGTVFTQMFLSYYSNENKLLIIAKKSGSSQTYYYYYDIGGTTLTEITTHPIDNDISINKWSMLESRVTTVVSGNDTYLIWHITNLYSCLKGDNNDLRTIAIRHHKLVFNQTLTASAFLNQYRGAMNYFPNYGSGQTTESWVIGFQSSNTIKFYYANQENGENTVYKAIFEMTNYDAIDQAVSFSEVEIEEASGYASFLYRDPSAQVRKILWSDDWIAELYSSTCYLWYNLPVEYTSYSITVEISPDPTDGIAKEVSYIFTITLTGDNLPVQGATIKFYDDADSEGNLQLRVTTTTNSDGEARISAVYGTALTQSTITIKIEAYYAGDLVSTWQQTYNLISASWSIQVSFEPNDDPLIKNKPYLVTVSVLMENQPKSNVLLKVYDDISGQKTLQFQGTTDQNGNYTFGATWGVNNFTLYIDAYYDNVLVTSWQQTLYLTDQGYTDIDITTPSSSNIILQKTIGDIISLLPALIMILVPTFAFYSVLQNIHGLIIGLTVGVIITSLAGLLPIYAIFLIALAVIAYFIYTIKR